MIPVYLMPTNHSTKPQLPSFEIFTKNFEDQFQNPFPQPLDQQTEFRELEEWTSLQALIIISSFDWDYQVSVSADELRTATTMQDLYNIVISKLAN